MSQHLSAVPGARGVPRADHLTEQFRRRAAEVLQRGGPEAVDQLVSAYLADVGALRATLEAAQVEASTAAADARSRYDMLQQAHASASQTLLHVAQQAAEVSACRGALERVRRATEAAVDGVVASVDVLAALTVEPGRPVYTPTMTAFTPDSRFRAGYFEAEGGGVFFTFPFAGFGLVDHGPGAAGILETVFLVGPRLLPQSTVEAERLARLKRMLPAVTPLAAA